MTDAPGDLLLHVPVFSDGKRRGEEALPVALVTPGRYRLLASPGFVEGCANGDEIALDDAAPHGYRVLARGGNLCVWLYFDHEVGESSPEARDVQALVHPLGGWLDGGWSRMLVFTLPVSAGFPAVERALDEAVARYPGARWFYGNVYDPVDGETPIGWWTEGR